MPRDHARVNVLIWNDPDFRRLPALAQSLYLTLWTSPTLSYCGVHDWQPGRLAALSADMNSRAVETVGDCLQARHFLAVDRDTEEVLIRSWARFDGLMKQPKMAISYVYAYSATASERLRSVLVWELRKIRAESPDLTCWKDKRVDEVLSHPAISAKDLDVPVDPFGEGVGEGFTPGLGLGLPEARGRVSTRVSTPPTPYSLLHTPSPERGPAHGEAASAAAPPPATKDKPARRKTRLPDDFKPSEKHEKLAADLGIDLAAEWPKFCDHWRSNGDTKVDWDATLRNWIRREHGFRGSSRSGDGWMRR